MSKNDRRFLNWPAVCRAVHEYGAVEATWSDLARQWSEELGSKDKPLTNRGLREKGRRLATSGYAEGSLDARFVNMISDQFGISMEDLTQSNRVEDYDDDLLRLSEVLPEYLSNLTPDACSWLRALDDLRGTAQQKASEAARRVWFAAPKKPICWSDLGLCLLFAVSAQRPIAMTMPAFELWTIAMSRRGLNEFLACHAGLLVTFRPIADDDIDGKAQLYTMLLGGAIVGWPWWRRGVALAPATLTARRDAESKFSDGIVEVCSHLRGRASAVLQELAGDVNEETRSGPSGAMLSSKSSAP